MTILIATESTEQRRGGLGRSPLGNGPPRAGDTRPPAERARGAVDSDLGPRWHPARQLHQVRQGGLCRRLAAGEATGVGLAVGRPAAGGDWVLSDARHLLDLRGYEKSGPGGLLILMNAAAALIASTRVARLEANGNNSRSIAEMMSQTWAVIWSRLTQVPSGPATALLISPIASAAVVTSFAMVTSSTASSPPTRRPYHHHRPLSTIRPTKVSRGLDNGRMACYGIPALAMVATRRPEIKTGINREDHTYMSFREEIQWRRNPRIDPRSDSARPTAVRRAALWLAAMVIHDLKQCRCGARKAPAECACWECRQEDEQAGREIAGHEMGSDFPGSTEGY